ncbi:hypothetical protein BKH46_07150 [Helicobacter sp. 12S02634-8]|uniref:RNB domain-containing ribonuclease n=1 Tax=Helicobacter sp. 12S02634-8 TaxID=1476199 RepID=UPI000BA6BCE5|nr:ribonuclease R family protein [Helicobacter sp. 12S02634-8]PAF46512.1 hypothetical protein BKH46_07150 [Helicobacter sp. 12S02634-8]
MKNFLFQLAYGIKSVPRKHQRFLKHLQDKGFVRENNGNYCLQKGFVIGSVDISRNHRVFFCPIGDTQHKDWILHKPPTFIAQNDIILCKIIRLKGHQKAQFITTLYTPNNQIICYLKQIKGTICAIDLKNPQHKPITLKASKKSLQALPRFCVLSIDANSKEICEVLGPLEDPLIDEKISLALYGRKREFSPASLLWAQSFGKQVDPKMYPERKDLSALPFCTIDPDDAKDHDDAIYYDSSRSCLYVAIADVSEYVSIESSIDIDARKRGFSVYLPHKSYPMLPPNLSENICSLKQGCIRLAFVWKMRLHRRHHKVLETSLFPALICNHQNISYSDVDKLLKGENIPINTQVKQSILDFLPIARALRTKRLKKGYEFFNDELKLELNTEGLLQKVNITYPGPSHTIIEEAMLLANKLSAELLSAHLGTQGIYRIHDSPSKERIQELLFELRSLGFITPDSRDLHHCIQAIQKQAKKKNMQKQVDKMIIKAQSQASYASYNIGHFGLGFEAYSHFTSPIRRYGDLIAHRLLKEIIKDSPESKKTLSYLAASLSASCALINEQEKQSTKIELDFKDRKYARWAAQNIGTKIQGVIIDTNYPPLIHALDGIMGARVFAESIDMDIDKLDCVQVEITDADIATARIYGKITKRL